MALDVIPRRHFESGHQSFARSLVQDFELEVVSQGDQFYNECDIPVLYFLVAFGDHVRYAQPGTWTADHHREVIEEAEAKCQDRHRIVIAQTPDWVDQRTRNRLDGGIIHEAFHSLYSTTGQTCDRDRLMDIMTDTYDADVPFGAKKDLLKTLWNIYEDAFIERQGIQDYNGAKQKIQCVHEFVWEREAIPLQKGEMSPVDQWVCYLRDRLESYLHGRPLERYDANLRSLADRTMEDLIESGRQTEDSYDCFELAMRSLVRMHRLWDWDDEDDNEENATEGEQGDGDDGANRPGGIPSPRPTDGTEDTSDSPLESIPPPSDLEDDPSDDPSDSTPGHGDDKDTAGDATGSPNTPDAPESSADPGPGSSDTADQSDRDDASAAGDGDEDSSDDGLDLEQIKRDLHHTESVDHPENISDALHHLWDDTTHDDCPPQVHPFSEEYDTWIHLDEADGDRDLWRTIREEVRQDTTYLRPKFKSLLRGQTVTRRVHRQPSGRRLSPRSIAEVGYKDNPRPFMNKTRETADNACLSLWVDESGSMHSRKEFTRKAAAILTLTLGHLQIPFEVVGFSTNKLNALDQYIRQHRDRLNRRDESIPSFRKRMRHSFTRTSGCQFRVFRSFDDPFFERSYQKLTATQTQGSTPLADAIDQGGKRLARRTEEKRFLMVLTDGRPTYAMPWSKEDYLRIIRNQIEALETLSIRTMFVGIEQGATFVERYPRSVGIRDLDAFSTRMVEFLMEQIQSHFK